MKERAIHAGLCQQASLLPSLFLSCSTAQGGRGSCVAQHQTLNQGAAAPVTSKLSKLTRYTLMLGGREGWCSCLPRPTANTGTKRRNKAVRFAVRQTSLFLFSQTCCGENSHPSFVGGFIWNPGQRTRLLNGSIAQSKALKLSSGTGAWFNSRKEHIVLASKPSVSQLHTRHTCPGILSMSKA